MKNNNLVIGKIRTSFGVKGFVKIMNFSGEKDHFFELKEVVLQNGKIREKKKIEEVLPHGNNLVIRFEGIHTPEAAKKYINWEMWVSRENACALGEGEYYLADLYGSALVSTPEKGSKVYGRVKSVICECGTTDFLEVESIGKDLDAGGSEDEKDLTGKEGKKVFLVPFTNKFVGKVDTENKTIELLEEWIIP
ncbi:MAG: ribosome maturation factor RimM [Spirochaetes bacterium]|nr:ribosome maturation factor RimM [Spirochaetota bacterium]